MRAARSRFPEPTSQPLCTRQLGPSSERHAPAGAPDSQIVTFKIPTHPCLSRRPTAPAGALSWSRAGALAWGEPAADRSRCSARARSRAWGREPRRSGRRRRRRRRRGFAGGGGERGGGEGLGERDPNPQPGSQRSLPGGVRALRSAPSCNRAATAHRLAAPRVPHHRRRRRTTGSLSSPPSRCFSRGLLLPNS